MIEIPPPAEPDAAFAAVVSLRRLTASLERSTVDYALANSWTWAQIGEALGMSAQAAHKRLSPTRRTPLT